MSTVLANAATGVGLEPAVPYKRRSVMFVCVRRVLAVVAVAALVGGCMSRPVDRPSAAEQKQPPYGVGVEVGKTYAYVLVTHCGIVQAEIDGSVWLADPPLGTMTNPPEGWDNPKADGTLRLISKDKAEFVDDGGNRAWFVRAEAAPQLCD